MTYDVIGVCGFGRCGSSLVMQMLAAAGVPVTGDAVYPGFEDERVLALLTGGPRRWITEARGAAIKFLDPQRYRLPAGPRYKFIWMKRDEREQAKSQIKFMEAMFPGSVRTDRPARLLLAASYAADKPRALARLAEVSSDPPLTIAFEDLIRSPRATADTLAAYIGGLDADKMAACVLPRNPKCYPGLMESKLLEAAA